MENILIVLRFFPIDLSINGTMSNSQPLRPASLAPVGHPLINLHKLSEQAATL